MCTYMHPLTHTHPITCTCTLSHTTCLHTRSHTFTPTRTHMHTPIHIHMHTPALTHLLTHMHTPARVHMYTCSQAHAQTHKHTHVHTCSQMHAAHTHTCTHPLSLPASGSGPKTVPTGRMPQTLPEWVIPASVHRVDPSHREEGPEGDEFCACSVGLASEHPTDSALGGSVR